MITTYEQFKEKVSKGIKVVVFTADWIPLSKDLYEELLKMVEHLKIDVIEVDVAMAPKVMEVERIFAIPTVKLYVNGKNLFTQEDTTGNVKVDATHVLRAVKEILKKKGIAYR